MRADAKRNHDRIVEAAREAFRKRGYDASLDESPSPPASAPARSTGTSPPANHWLTR